MGHKKRNSVPRTKPSAAASPAVQSGVGGAANGSTSPDADASNVSDHKPHNPSKIELTPPQSEGSDYSTIKLECERALTTLRRGNHNKAMKLLREICSREEGSPHSAFVHRVHSLMCFKTATVITDPSSKQRHLKNALESARHAVELMPNSVEYAHFRATVMLEAASEGKDYEDVVHECERGLAIENPSDPAKETLQDESEQKASSTEERIAHVQNELRQLIQKSNIASLSSWMKNLSNGEERFRLIPIRRTPEDPMEVRLVQTRRPNEIKKVTKTPEERRKEIEVRVAAARLLQQKSEAPQSPNEGDRDDRPLDSSAGSGQRIGDRRRHGNVRKSGFRFQFFNQVSASNLLGAMEAQQRRGGLVPLSPSQTVRSGDKQVRDLRSADSNSTGHSKFDKDKGVNVQVLVRCRPLSEDEARLNTPIVISCNEGRREVSAVQNIANKQIDRTFAFDKVFGPNSKQKELYEQAVSPIVNEVLEGYNCTIFAYGQTGTGKTYTMEGGARKKNGEFPSDAGVIPRAVKQIFDILEAQNAEYSMKVTFLELYNEEITDLLAPEETLKFVDDKSKKPIALMEDGKGGVFVRGLEEEVVCTANEIYKILEKGSAKRRTAETLLNKQSSRSHSIFSITIHIKECTPEGEEMIKCGKLNLVDLAGSENISRSGAREGRAREAGEINKSLLTLGRVINALVEHSGHVPYRDSKLTRLLRDSLGGKTKTCIVATISPSIHCLDETLSTLDYAHRAKNIKNKPEINQKMVKSALIKDLYSEIDRLKQEVYAAREKNGIYIPRDRYLHEEAEKKAMVEKIERMEQEAESKDKQLVELQELYNSQQLLTVELSDKLEKTEKSLEETEQSLLQLEEKHTQANATIKEKEFLIFNLLKSEKTLVEHAIELRADLENAASDVSNLFSTIERKDKIEEGNRLLIHKFQSQLAQQLEDLHKTVAASVIQQEQQLKSMEQDMHSFVSTKAEAIENLRVQVGKLKNMYGSGIEVLDNLAEELKGNNQLNFEELNSEVARHSSALEDLFGGIALEADSLLKDLQSSLQKQEAELTAYARQQEEAHARAVENTRAVSKITVNFFETLHMHASNLIQIVEESQCTNDQKLDELQKKFEECTAYEEKQLLEKVAEMLAISSSRKKKLVQLAVNDLRESANIKISKLRQETLTMQDSTSSVKAEWKIHMEKTESNYHEDTSAVESGKNDLVEILRYCRKKAEVGAQQWRNAQESILSQEKRNAASVDTIIRGGMEANNLVRARFSGAASTTLEHAEISNKAINSSIEHSLQLDHDACGNINSMIIPCCGDLRELKGGHYHRIVEITENAGKCLLNEYIVDEPSCSTPRKRPFNLPSVSSIEELRTPPFEELLKSFSDSKSPKHSNGDVRYIGAYEAAQSVRDSRVPLIAIN